MLDREVAGIHPYMLWKVVERKKGCAWCRVAHWSRQGWAGWVLMPTETLYALFGKFISSRVSPDLWLTYEIDIWFVSSSRYMRTVVQRRQYRAFVQLISQVYNLNMTTVSTWPLKLKFVCLSHIRWSWIISCKTQAYCASPWINCVTPWK